MAVEVPSGAGAVALTYRPRTLLLSLAAFPLFWAFWLVWFIMAGTRRGGRRRLV